MSILTRPLTLTWKQIGLSLFAIVVVFLIVTIVEQHDAVPLATSYEWVGDACMQTFDGERYHDAVIVPRRLCGH